MKKYLLRILTVLLIVCFGACLFAACGGNGDNDDEPATYTLTYDANGGTGADITEKHKEGEKVTLKGADAFTYEGHTFTGWNDGTTTYEAGKEFTMPANNVTMKAQWQENSDVPAYTIKVTDPSGKAHVEFDKQGPYHKGDVVKFTVDFAPGEDLRVTSVKADGAELQKGEDGMYTVTFAEKDIEITITSESTGAHEFNVSLSVTGDGNGNSAALDKQGTVGKDEKVTLTVVTAEGYSAEVKLNGNHVDLNAEGKYELTVTADAAFTVTFTKNGENPPAKTYTVTCTSQHVTVKFDQNGPYNTGTVVTFTVTAEAGYEIVSVKNGSDTLQEQNGKYSVTVGEADIVITVETREVSKPQPQGKKFTEFLIADIQRLDAAKFQISIQAKATGYASTDEMKADVKLLIGTQEFPANDVTRAESGIYNLFFPVEIAQLTIAKDASAPVKLKSTAANNTYDCPATSVNEVLNSVQFEQDIYTLEYASNSLTLKHTQVEVVEKKITFAGTAFDFDGEGKLYIVLNLQTQGYEEAAVLAAKLKIGTLEFSVRADASNKGALRFDLTGGTPTVETLTAEKHAVVLVVGGDNYECPTVTTGQVGKQTKDNRTYTLNEESGKLYLTVEGSSVTPPPTTGYTVTYTGEHVNVTFEKNGPYEANTVVYFTVTVESGYKLVSVKNGDTVLQEEDGKYFVTVADANIVLTIETASDGTTPQPSNKALKDFADSNVLPLNNTTFQLILRAKADGYANEEELKADVKLLIGLVEIEAHGVTKAESGIYNLFFHVEASKLANIGDGAEVKLKLTSANQVYDCPSSAVNGTEFQVQFEHDVYTLKLENGKLVLAHTYEAVVEKKITFAGTAFELDGEGKLYIMINLQTVQGYEAAEIEAAKLKVGSLEFTAIVDPANKSVLRFNLTGGEPTVETLAAQQYAVVLVVGSENYECPTVSKGQVGQQKKGGQTFTLKEEGGKLYLTVEGSAVQLDPIEGVWTGTYKDSNDDSAPLALYIKKGASYIDVAVQTGSGSNVMYQAMRLPLVSENDYKAEVTALENDVQTMEIKLGENNQLLVTLPMVNGEAITLTAHSTDMGHVDIPTGGTYSYKDENAELSVTFGAQPTATLKPYFPNPLTGVEYVAVGKYILCYIEVEGQPAGFKSAPMMLSAGADENTLTAYFAAFSYTLTKEGTTPTAKSISDFGSSEIGVFGTEGFRILLRAKATGYTVNTLKAALKIKINDVLYSAQEVGADSDGTYRIYFLIKNEEAAAIGNGDYKVVLIVEGQTEEVKAITSQVEASAAKVENGGKTYSLKAENNELTLTVAGESTPKATFTATGATLNASGEKVCFVLSGTATGLADANAVKTALSDIYFDLQELNTQNYQTTFTRTVTVEDPQDGVYSWKIEFDISSLEAKANAYIAHFQAASGGDNPGVDLKLTVEQAVPNTTVQNSAHKFTLLNENGQTDAEHNWGCVAVKVEDLAQSHVHTFENGVCTGCSAVCGHEGQSGATCELCGATLVTNAKYTNPTEFITWYDVPAELTKGNQIILYGTQTTTMTDTASTIKDAAGQDIPNPNLGQPVNHGSMIWESKEGFTGRMDNYGWKFGETGNFGTAVTNKVLQNLDASGKVVEGDFNWTLYQDICKDSIWVIRIAYASESALTVSMYVTSLSGEHAGYTFVCVYDVPISAGKAQAKYTFHLSAGSAGGCTEFSVTGYATAALTTTPDIPFVPETGTTNVPAGDIPSWTAPFLPHDVATLTDGITVKIAGQFKDAGTATWNGLMFFLRNGQTDQLLYVFRQAGDCADVTADPWAYGQGVVTPGFMGDPIPSDTNHPSEEDIAKANAYIALKKNAKFEAVVTYSESKVTITVTVFGTDDTKSDDDQVLSVVLSNMTVSSYDIALALDGATLTDTGLTVTTTAASSSPAKQSAVFGPGDILTYEATAVEIGSATEDGVAVQLNVGGGKYIQFCADGLHILSDDGEETIGQNHFFESRTFNGANFPVEASVDLTQMLNAKKKM